MPSAPSPARWSHAGAVGTAGLPRPPPRPARLRPGGSLRRPPPAHIGPLAAIHSSISLWPSVSGPDSAAFTILRASDRAWSRPRRTATASVPVRPTPAPQWIRIRSPVRRALAVSFASARNAIRSSGTPWSVIGNSTCLQGTPRARAAWYSGDVFRISSRGARHITRLIFLLAIAALAYSSGSYRPGMLWRQRWPVMFGGSFTSRTISSAVCDAA